MNTTLTSLGILAACIFLLVVVDRGLPNSIDRTAIFIMTSAEWISRLLNRAAQRMRTRHLAVERQQRELLGQVEG